MKYIRTIASKGEDYLTNVQKAFGSAFLYAIITGFALMIVKVALNYAGVIDVLAHRFTLSFIVASLLLLVNKQKMKVNRHDVLRILPLGLLFPICYFGFQALGLLYTTSSEASIIQASVPIFTLLLATYLLKETSTPRQKFSILLSVSGIVYILAMKGVNFSVSGSIGALFILLAALSNASYNVLARKLTRSYSTIELTYVMMFVGFIGFNGVAVVHHSLNGSLATFFKPLFQLGFLLSVAYLGIFSSLITAFLSNYALKTIQAAQMSVFTNLATLIGVVAGVAFLHEHLSYFHWIGGLAIMIGIIGTTYQERSRAQKLSKKLIDKKLENS